MVSVIRFIVLFNTAIIATLVRSRLIRRASNPLIKWNVVRELPYTPYVIGIFS